MNGSANTNGRATVEQALARLNFKPRELEPGHVWLAGAGPGDPGCLTLEVLAALGQCDALVYDALVSPDVVAVAQGAELFYAGKRGGQPSMKQDDINALLVRLAREGRRVVRLKGGDPYIFGRGGEEALALAGDNIPFRVLSGLTSGLSALAATGIPGTMRGINKAVILATGHAAGTDDDIDWAAIAGTGQPVVVYMGMANLPRIAAALLKGGLAPSTPAAVIVAATTPLERIVVATLATIAEAAAAAGLASPALIVVGGIVGMRAALVGGT
ncbi:uroporphyrinogen-III C-methyltransferase [Mesorhizobium australafricanum]|uniref:uroporphyrinogen-III C-methyltransferase n=1 Tax=Mesorhizobium australafricanum TaxID=3072311 RepID=A0ABU4WTA3_9HYPH|nr:uroporphyrinogen-III C-methyltransferase [Mesorhizobium sp. VK3E]MDX8439290.1 uroporphyrinogen-III C-methyltransferase [Mesorhizobium sp. VK3E]